MLNLIDMKLILSLTTCKRFNLFLETILSFYTNCNDLHLITEIVHFDDSSSKDEREKMRIIFNNLFPNIKYTTFYIDEKSISSKKRHLEIMKLWKIHLEKIESDYCFHLEDDWKFVKPFTLQSGLDLLSVESEVALVGYSWQMKKFPENVFTPKIIGNFWEWCFLPDREINDNLCLDEVEMSYLPEDVWVSIINWPYFGFRPGIHDVKKLSKLDNFEDTDISFELEFAIRYSKLYKSYLHKERICYHIGDENSSYDINNSKR